MTVLLLEPDFVLAGSYKKALIQAGHGVVWQPDAQTAIHQIDKEKPDVIVLEPQLRKHSGIEFLYELNSYSDLIGIPVVIQSFIPPSVFEAQSTMLKMIGVKSCLYKPTTTLRQLVKTLERINKLAIVK